MRIDIIRNLLLYPAVLLAAAALATGCIKDDTSGCPDAFSLTVRAVDNDGANIDAQAPQVILYIFDARNRFVGQIPTAAGQSVAIEPIGEDMRIIAWGNLGAAAPVFAYGEDISAHRISLVPDTRAASPYLSPGDLFFGQTTHAQGDQSGEKVITLTRKTGSMNVSIKNLKEYSGFADDNFLICVGDTYSQLDMEDNLCGDMAFYRPDGTFSSNIFTVPSFNMLCGTGLYIDIYHESDKILTVNSYNGGLPIDVQEGMTTSVLIDFSAGISVSVYVLEWGEQQTWKEF